MKGNRELFVKKYREVFKVDKSLFVNDNGEFIDKFCQSVYEIWQSRVPEGYVAVPVEINDEIESAMFSSVARGEMPCDIYKAMIGAAVENQP